MLRDRIVQIRQKQDDSTFTNWMPIGAQAQDIEVEVDTSINADGYTDLQSLLDSGVLAGTTEWVYI